MLDPKTSLELEPSSARLQKSKEVREALFKLDQQKKELQKSWSRIVDEIRTIDLTQKQIEDENREIINDCAPLLNLPTEVTCMIFDFCVATPSLPKFGKISLPEVVISHVCQYWRDISLRYPRLWRRFLFYAANVGQMCNPIVQWHTYMERSSTETLELSLNFIDTYRPDGPWEIQRKKDKLMLLYLALTQVKRWKIATLRYLLDNHRLEIQGLLTSASAPNLEYLAFSPGIRRQLHPSSGLRPTIFKGNTPQLRYLVLDCSLDQGLPPLSNITTLRIEANSDLDAWGKFVFPWPVFLEILSIPPLSNLSLVGATSPPAPLTSSKAISMNNLKHLRYRGDICMTLLLPFLHAPLLETLAIRNDNRISEHGYDLIGVPIESRFFPSLHTLTIIESSPFSSNSAWRLMKLTRNVKNIIIDHTRDNNNFFSGLQKHGPFNDKECWPNLTSITAHLRSRLGIGGTQIEVIRDFVLSRHKDTLKLNLFEQTHLSWLHQYPAEYKTIQENCILNALTPEEEVEHALKRPLWPPGVHCPEYAFTGRNDPFSIDKVDWR